MIMPSNNLYRGVKELYKKHPDKIGILNTPTSWKNPTVIKNYAIDNGCFCQFSEDKFFSILTKSKSFHDPMFVVCPDVVGCHDRTSKLWLYYYQIISEMGFKVAFVAQDGCTPKDVPKEAYCCFVGGLDPWKDNNIKTFVGVCEWTHVGRVNGLGRLNTCLELGVDSIDGTGLWANNYYKLYNILGESSSPQMELF